MNRRSLLFVALALAVCLLADADANYINDIVSLLRVGRKHGDSSMKKEDDLDDRDDLDEKDDAEFAQLQDSLNNIKGSEFKELGMCSDFQVTCAGEEYTITRHEKTIQFERDLSGARAAAGGVGGLFGLAAVAGGATAAPVLGIAGLAYYGVMTILSAGGQPPKTCDVTVKPQGSQAASEYTMNDPLVLLSVGGNTKAELGHMIFFAITGVCPSGSTTFQFSGTDFPMEGGKYTCERTEQECEGVDKIECMVNSIECGGKELWDLASYPSAYGFQEDIEYMTKAQEEAKGEFGTVVRESPR